MQKLKERISRHIDLMEFGKSEEGEDSKKTYCVFKIKDPQTKMCGFTYWQAKGYIAVNLGWDMEVES